MTAFRSTFLACVFGLLPACGGGTHPDVAQGPVTVVPSGTSSPLAADVAAIPAGNAGNVAQITKPPSSGPCSLTSQLTAAADTSEITAAVPGSNGWDERYRGRQLSLAGASNVYCQTFDGDIGLSGPWLWARQHSDFGLASFDAAGGQAYRFSGGKLIFKAYEDATGKHGGLVQSTSAAQAYQGEAIVPNQSGVTCAGCFWEARIRFPVEWGTWGAFWLLTPDDPKNRGHLEVDGIEYYGAGDKRGHHHGVHRWQNGVSSGSKGDYTGMDEIADGDWHTYGVDLRGRATLGGKPALVIYLDGKEVGRLDVEQDYFQKPFYYVLNLAIHKEDRRYTFPQEMEVDHVTVWR